MTDFKHELGLEAKSKVTGFEGIIIARSECLYGCNRYLIQPKVTTEGKSPDAFYHDEEKIEIVGDGVCVAVQGKTTKSKKTGPPASLQPTGASKIASLIALAFAVLCITTASAQTPMPSVPEPVGDYEMPAARIGIVEAGPDTLRSAMRAISNGVLSADRIVLEPGEYSRLESKYDTYPTSTGRMLQIIGQDGVIIDGADFWGADHILFYDVDFTAKVKLDNDSWGFHFVNCGFNVDTRQSAFHLTNTKGQGEFQFIDCRFEGPWRPGMPYFDYGYAMQMSNHNHGDNWRIAGCYFDGWGRDCIMFGNFLAGARPNDPDSPAMDNILIERNIFARFQDDAIEADKFFRNLVICDNVIGGSEPVSLAGISLAPGGPGPIEIYGNSISGYTFIPIKFNTEVDDAYTRNVNIHNNVLVTDYKIEAAWYWGIPAKLLANVKVHNNMVSTRGSLFVAEGGWNPPGIEIYDNRLFSTAEHSYWGGDPPHPLFRYYDAASKDNIYFDTLADMRLSEAFDYHEADTWDASLANPVPILIGDLPNSLVCRWEFGGGGAVPEPTVEPTATPTPEPTATPTPKPEPTPGLPMVEYEVEVTQQGDGVTTRVLRRYRAGD